MHLGTILVHLDHSEDCVNRVGLASSMARTHGSHLVGLVPTGVHFGLIPANAIAAEDTEITAASADYLRTRAEAVAHVFKDQMRGVGPLSYDVRVVDELSADAVIRHARCSDLVIVGQDDGADATIANGLPALAVLHAGRPVLIVPRAKPSHEPAGKALVAWDGSREAGVALRDALPLLSRALVVTLLTLRRADEADDADVLLIPQTIAWLQRHGVSVVAEQLVTGNGFSDALLSAAARMKADLLVMGGYGHTRLRELVLGGVTHRILSDMDLPVLMAH